MQLITNMLPTTKNNTSTKYYNLKKLCIPITLSPCILLGRHTQSDINFDSTGSRVKRVWAHAQGAVMRGKNYELSKT